VVSPQATDTVARVEALASWMKANAGLNLNARAAVSYKDLVTSVREGSSDLAWLPPVPYAWLAEAVTPIGSIVRDGDTTYSAALVVRDGSPLKKLSDLAGVRAGWVDPWSAAGYVVPRLELARAKIEPQSAFSSETFYGSHRAALIALGKSECDVVGTYARTPKDGGPATEGAWTEIDDLHVHVLATFRSIPSDIVAARRNLGPVEFEAAQRAFKSAFADEEGRKLAQALFGGSDLHEGVDRGHDKLRRAYESAIANGLFD
jgi:phosphate/phosphite/phosphonate ABC transporter binding protein